MLPTTIPWKLLQGIALVQLYLEERWVEPPRLDRLPFSLLYHQTMSTLASCGELSPRALADRVLRLHYFHRITQEDYRVLLRHLIATDHIQQTEQGGLIVGLAGERVINSFKFYGVFQESEEYTVRSESQELGTVVSPPPVGEKLAIGGTCLAGAGRGPQAPPDLLSAGEGQRPRLFRPVSRRPAYQDSGKDAPGTSGGQTVPLPDEKRGGKAGAGPLHRRPLRRGGKAAHQSGRQHVVPASMGRDVHLPDHGAVPENQMRRPPRPGGIWIPPARFLFSSP